MSRLLERTAAPDSPSAPRAVVPARAIGAAALRLRAIEPRSVRRGAVSIELPHEIRGRALVAAEGAGIAAIADGNRSAVLAEPRVVFAGREWLVGVKGVGAASPLYGATPIDDVLGDDFAGDGGEPLPPRAIAGEAWMGESPYGGQGEIGAAQALEVTALAAAGSIEGVHVCPVACVHELPETEVRRDVFWYRRHRGPVLQEVRLVPSDVRLFHSSGRALAKDPEGVLEELGVEGVPALDAFVDRFVASGIAALTLWARTARPCEGGMEGLDYVDAWLDKDSLVGTDGTIFVADLESVEWTPTTHRIGAEARVRQQIDRNQYELFYGLDALLDVRDRWEGTRSPAARRRASVATRLELALEGDRWVRAVEDDAGVALSVCVAGRAEPVRAPFLDRR
jgi:hypothetical protein